MALAVTVFAEAYGDFNARINDEVKG